MIVEDLVYPTFWNTFAGRQIVEVYWFGFSVFAFAVGVFLGMKIAGSAMKPGLQEMAHDIASDRKNYLEILRREIVNHLMQRDPVKFKKVYERVHNEIMKYKTFSKEGLANELGGLCESFPKYSDFDLLATRSHVLYADAFASFDDEEVSEHFRTLVRFQALNARLKDSWSLWEPTSENDLEHLREYVRQIIDSRFEQRLKSAISHYRLCKSIGPEAYETPELSIVSVSHFAEIRYGVHFKDTGEYGLYGCFYGDRAKPHESYYRSNFLFEDETPLLGLSNVDYNDR